MRLNKKQVEALNNLIIQVQSLHSQWDDEGEDGYYGDTKDGVLDCTDEFIFSLGKIDKLMNDKIYEED